MVRDASFHLLMALNDSNSRPVELNVKETRLLPLPLPHNTRRRRVVPQIRPFHHRLRLLPFPTPMIAWMTEMQSAT
jgi:hypothetical protein